MIDRNLDFTKTLSNKMQDQSALARSAVNVGQDQQMDGQGYPAGPMGDEPSLQGLPPRGLTSQSVEGSLGTASRRAPQPRNDYDYIKLKNSSWGNKFDIISNKIKDFAK